MYTLKSKSVSEMYFPMIWRSKFTDLAKSKKKLNLWKKNGCRQKCLDKSLACQIWGQSKTKLFQETEKLQDKAICIISFIPKGASVKEAYNTLKILKIWDFISLQNALLVKDIFEEKRPSPFMIYFKKLNTQHLHTMHPAINQSASVPIVNTEIHSINSIKYRSVEIWNKLQKALPDDLLNLTRTKAKEQITTTLLKSYLSP